MGTTKTEHFSAEYIRAAQLAKALGHPARIAILRYLLERNECICGDIVDVLPLAQATVSQHLRELKMAGLIKGQITGARSCYCINETGWEEARQIFAGLLPPLGNRNSCC